MAAAARDGQRALFMRADVLAYCTEHGVQAMCFADAARLCAAH
jgi:hypothetical protein